MSHVRVNVLYSLWYLYLLFLFNLIPILFKLTNFVHVKDETKFNFYIKVDVNFNILYKIFNKKYEL